MLIIIVALVGCPGPAEPEACPADYSIEDCANEYAEALCYMAETCSNVRAVEGMSHEECLADSVMWVHEEMELCEAHGASLVRGVCVQWQCSRDIIASTADCATANNTCNPSSMYDDTECDWVE